MKPYDIVVIGAGSGGLTAAVTAAGFGKRVLLVDKDRPGGECTWSGCIPSKALISEAKTVHAVRSRVPEYVHDSKTALEYVRGIREKIYAHETPEVLKKSGIDYLKGEARFKDSRILQVGRAEVAGRKYIVSTGSSPFIPDIEGLDGVSFLTNESVFELERLPESLIVLGGGAIGVELAQAAARLGTAVQVVEMMPVLVPREETAFSVALQERLTAEGVTLHLGARATRVAGEGGGISLAIWKGDGPQVVAADALLVSIGRKPNVSGLGLEEAGVRFTPKGIDVNACLQTSRPHIYAIGDVAGPYQFSHMANVQGIRAVQNAVLPFKRKIRYDHVAWVTFTQPELARAGMTEAEARARHGDGIRVYEYDFNLLDRAVTGGETMERMKVVLDRKGKTLGVSILADRAGELIGEAQLLKSVGLNFAKLGSVIHPYPTYGEVFSKIGKRVMVDNLLGHPLVRLFRRRGSRKTSHEGKGDDV
jgi:pyruvate/2-oxoglutarate dehydrogenase complex dihydrolipoamide dehydrogenase (E3) component